MDFYRLSNVDLENNKIDLIPVFSKKPKVMCFRYSRSEVIDIDGVDDWHTLEEGVFLIKPKNDNNLYILKTNKIGKIKE